MENNLHNSGFFSPDGQLLEEVEAPLVEIGHQEGPFILYKCSKQSRNIVLKCIRSEYREQPLYWDMLRKEFEIGHSLNHPNIREYYSLTNYPELGLCIEMEWVDGESLDKQLSECHRKKELCDKFAAQILDAVRFMHLKQVIHRDLKPANILISHNGQNVKLIDFSLSDSDAHFILKGNAGTTHYASPEQIGCRPTDFRSDIYSLGVILSEMSDKARYRRIARKCMNSNPDRRYPDIDRLEKALFAPSHMGLYVIITALIITAALLTALTLSDLRMHDDSLDMETFEEIFRQATDLVEESDSNT